MGEADWRKTPGKLAIICHFDINNRYNLRKAHVVAGARGYGTRYCMIRLPRHEFEVSTGEIRFYDDQDGTWLGITQRRPLREDPCVEAARRRAEQQAETFLGELEAEIQASARSTVTQIAKAFGVHGTSGSNSTRLPLDRPGLRADIDSGLPRDCLPKSCRFFQEDAVADHLPHINIRVFTGSSSSARRSYELAAVMVLERARPSCGTPSNPVDRPGRAGGGHGRLVHVRRVIDGSTLARVPEVRGRRGGGQQVPPDVAKARETETLWISQPAATAARVGLPMSPPSVPAGDREDDQVYRETTVKDREGRLVAASSATSDYIQSDERGGRKPSMTARAVSFGQ